MTLHDPGKPKEGMGEICGRAIPAWVGSRCGLLRDHLGQCNVTLASPAPAPDEWSRERIQALDEPDEGPTRNEPCCEEQGFCGHRCVHACAFRVKHCIKDCIGGIHHVGGHGCIEHWTDVDDRESEPAPAPDEGPKHKPHWVSRAERDLVVDGILVMRQRFGPPSMIPFPTQPQAVSEPMTHEKLAEIEARHFAVDGAGCMIQNCNIAQMAAALRDAWEEIERLKKHAEDMYDGRFDYR